LFFIFLTKSCCSSLLMHNGNSFTALFKWLRWEAGQILARKLMLSLVDDFRHNKPLVLNSNFLDGFRRILSDSSLDKVC
jgi:hypothetical protein